MAERTYLPFEHERLKTLKAKMVTGPAYEMGGMPTDDMLKFIWAKELIHAGLPKQQWTLKMKVLKIDEDIKSDCLLYLKHLKDAQENGLGFFFYGANGVGKTSTAVAIATEALKKGLQPVYITAQTYMDFEMNDFKDPNRAIMFNRLRSADMIVFDEFDKVYINEKTKYALKKIENFLREMLGMNKMLVVCSNLQESEIKGTFNNSVYSLLQRHLNFIEFKGKDHSKERRSNWNAILTGKTSKGIDMKALMADAKEYFETNRMVDNG